jgi:hypothetical protein
MNLNANNLPVDPMVRHINKIICESIYHGGDLGGPYESNPDGLYAAMLNFKRWAGLDDYEIVHTDCGLAFMRPVVLDTDGKVRL